MSLNVPEFMPVLSEGAHASPAEGACIMEYASFLAGEEWSDTPSCTNTTLAFFAQDVNDTLDDEERQRLLPLLPRLMGTGGDSVTAGKAIAEAAREYVRHLMGHTNSSVDYWAREAQDSNYPAYAARMSAREADLDLVDFLSALIDAYDKATGRTAPATVTEDDLRRCAELTGATR